MTATILNITTKEWRGSGIGSITARMCINITVLLWYWVRSMQETCGDADQACETTMVMGLGLRGLWTDAWTWDRAFASFSRLNFHLDFYLYFTEQRFTKYSHC